MKSSAELYMEHLTEMFGTENDLHKVETEDGRSAVFVFFYEDLPEEGTLTAVTLGLSEAAHPEWVNGRPELILSLDTQNRDWGLSAAHFAAHYRGQAAFGYGETFTQASPLTDESPMNGFFVFAPSFLDKKESTITLPDRTIHLAGLYPLYPEEVPLFRRIGLEAFWHKDGFDMYNIKRKNLAL